MTAEFRTKPDPGLSPSLARSRQEDRSLHSHCLLGQNHLSEFNSILRIHSNKIDSGSNGQSSIIVAIPLFSVLTHGILLVRQQGDLTTGEVVYGDLHLLGLGQFEKDGSHGIERIGIDTQETRQQLRRIQGDRFRVDLGPVIAIVSVFQDEDDRAGEPCLRWFKLPEKRPSLSA